MNLILLNDDYLKDGEIKLKGQRALHVREVLRAQLGDTLRIGRINQGLSVAEVAAIGPDEVVLIAQQEWKVQAKAQRPILLVGLPRPKAFRRMLRHAVILGFKEIHFCHSYRVEKSYWNSPLLQSESVEKEILAGLEQAQDVHWPEVHFHRLFKPFMEDKVGPKVAASKLALCAHPYAPIWQSENSLPEAQILALGPEGGWIEYELKLMEGLGFKPTSFSTRILSSESALPYITGRLGFN